MCKQKITMPEKKRHLPRIGSWVSYDGKLGKVRLKGSTGSWKMVQIDFTDGTMSWEPAINNSKLEYPIKRH